jgi:signal transduction histidine kinase
MNAAKYTPPQGRIRLVAEDHGTEVVVKVIDTGIGIGADQVPHIFGMFGQVESALNRSQGGLGIGLWLARQLIDMHGGQISAHSEGVGKGSEFAVRLQTTLRE